MSRGVVHVVAGGFCLICGDTAEWLIEAGHEVVQACGDVLLAGHSTALDCVREAGHEGDHRSFGGSSWGAK